MIVAQSRGVKFIWRVKSAWGEAGWYPWVYEAASKVWYDVAESLGFIGDLNANNAGSYAVVLTEEGKDFRQRYVNLVPEGSERS